jgi:hypothetical protein
LIKKRRTVSPRTAISSFGIHAARFAARYARGTCARQHVNRDLVQGLFAHTGRPPELRVLDWQVQDRRSAFRISRAS